MPTSHNNYLLSPGGKMSVFRRFKTRDIHLELLVDVDKARRDCYSASYAEAESMCLRGSVIGILSQYNDLCILNMAVCAPGEHILGRRVDGEPLSLALHEINQFVDVWHR